MYTSSGAINFICDSHPSRYNFENIGGMLRSVPKYRQSKARVRGSSWLIIFKIPWACQKFSFQLSELPSISSFESSGPSDAYSSPRRIIPRDSTDDYRIVALHF